MPARGYESLSSSVQLELDIYRVEHEKIKFVSTSGHVIFCLLYRHQ